MHIPKIFRVLYSPSKVFKELMEKPSYIGVILIFVLFIASNILSNYIRDSKFYLQKVKPDPFEGKGDEWTENATLWKSNGKCWNESDNLYGRYSVACEVNNTNELWIQMNFSESINCSAQEFNQTSFSIKLFQSNNATANFSLILFSGSSDFFLYRLKEVENGNIWNNITIPMGEKGWIKSVKADWSTISGIKFLIEFSEDVNATLFLDALFFRGQYEPATKYFPIMATYYGVSYSLFFWLFWLIFGGLLHILTRYSGSNLTWKHNLLISGYSLASLYVQGMFLIGLFLFLPQINVPRGMVEGLMGDRVLIFDLATYSQFIFFIWGIVISMFAIRTLNDFTTGKSAAISIGAYFAALSLESILAALLLLMIFGF